jgi:hypothetical protein
MKITNLQVQDSIPALETLSKVKLPAKAAFAIAKSIRKLQEIDVSINKVLTDLYNKYGDKNEDGTLKIKENKLTFAGDNFKNFIKEKQDLMLAENELVGLRVIKIDELGEASVEPSVLGMLDWLIQME